MIKKRKNISRMHDYPEEKVRKGLLRRIGTHRGGYWEVIR